MLPVAPPGGASAFVPTQLSVARTSALPNDHVLLALPPTATSASVLRSLRTEGVSVSAVADSDTFDWSTRNEIQLGRYEYCMDTSAVSPPYMYSSESVTFRSTQPVPVGVRAQPVPDHDQRAFGKHVASTRC